MANLKSSKRPWPIEALSAMFRLFSDPEKIRIYEAMDCDEPLTEEQIAERTIEQFSSENEKGAAQTAELFKLLSNVQTLRILERASIGNATADDLRTASDLKQKVFENRMLNRSEGRFEITTF